MLAFSIRRAGVITFAIGVMMFLGDQYVLSALIFLPRWIVPQIQLAEDIIVSAAYVTLQPGGLVLAFAGAIMFIVGRQKEKALARSGG